MDKLVFKGISTNYLDVDIFDCTKEQLDEVYAIHQQARQHLQAKEILKFRPGMDVSFMHKGELHRGIVEKVNQKTVSVKVGAIGWNCSPGLLTVIEPHEIQKV